MRPGFCPPSLIQRRLESRIENCARRCVRNVSAPKDERTASAYLFGAICPKHGKGAALVLTRCNIAAMTQHLQEIAAAVEPGAHAVLLLDQAGWRLSAKLAVPPNITIMPLPPKAPELNPVENPGSGPGQALWQSIRDNSLSNRIFQSCEDRHMDALQDAPDAFFLLSLFERYHSGRQSFAIAPMAMSRAETPPWHYTRIARARDVLLERGFLIEVSAPERGRKRAGSYRLKIADSVHNHFTLPPLPLEPALVAT